MSGKRTVPSLWASRGAMVAAVTAVAMVVWAVVGAWMLFAPRPDRPAATPVAPETTDEAVLAEDVEPEPTFEEMAAPNTDWGSVRTLAPTRAKPPKAVAHPPQTEAGEPSAEAGPDGGDRTGGDGGGDADGDGSGDGDGDGDGTGGDGGDDGGGDEPVDDHPGRGNGPKDPPGRR